MRGIARNFKRLIIGTGLLATAMVLFPDHVAPLWDWGKATSASFGYDALPKFVDAQGYAGLGLLTLVIGGILYNLWRDRRFDIMQAEYNLHTGATHLKQKVRELEKQLEKTTAEREEWQKKYEALNRVHTAALVAAKEHEVRGQFGQEALKALAELRLKFEEVLREKGYSEGLRMAMDFMLRDLTYDTQRQSFSVQSTDTTAKKDRNGPRSALPFGR